MDGSWKLRPELPYDLAILFLNTYSKPVEWALHIDAYTLKLSVTLFSGAILQKKPMSEWMTKDSTSKRSVIQSYKRKIPHVQKYGSNWMVSN